MQFHSQLCGTNQPKQLLFELLQLNHFAIGWYVLEGKGFLRPHQKRSLSYQKSLLREAQTLPLPPTGPAL